MKVFVLLLLLANLVYAGWYHLVAAPLSPAPEAFSLDNQGERLVLLSELDDGNEGQSTEVLR